MKHKNLQKITDLRHELHMYPELSMQETETAARLRKFLEDNTGFQVVDRGNWFYAVRKVKGAKNKIAFRADMDIIQGMKASPTNAGTTAIALRCADLPWNSTEKKTMPWNSTEKKTMPWNSTEKKKIQIRTSTSSSSRGRRPAAVQ